MDPVIFSIGGFDIKWYSVLILLSIIIGIALINKEAKKFKIQSDFVFNLAFWTLIFAFIGARLYYVAFNFSLYENNLLDIVKIWEGGLAIHGGLIFGFLTYLIYCKKYGVSLIKILDITVPAVLLGQAIGRWGNFFNKEAYGPVTTLESLQEGFIPEFIIDGMFINGNYHYPTFFYESIWCLVGFLILLIIRRLRYVKIGQMFSFYLMWYGAGRFFIESIRTDSLMAGGFKAAQIISIIMFVIGLGATMIISRKGKFEDMYNIAENEVRF